MGGAKVKVGDGVTIDVAPTDLGISGSIYPENKTMPYITGDIDFGIDQMKKELIPAKLTRKIFSLAENQKGA